MNAPDCVAADELLETWQQRLNAVTRNANELSEAEFVKRIRNRLREQRYAGLTLARAQAALEALSSLMDDYLLLAHVIDDAIEAHRGGFLTSREAREEQVRALLEGPSIERPAACVPLHRRELLGAAQQHDRITPQALLTAMEAAFRQARDTLAEIDVVEQLGASDLSELRHDFAALTQRADALDGLDGQGAPADRPTWIELPDRPADPLARREGIASQRRSLQAWSLRLDEIDRARAAAQSGVTLAREGLAELKRLTEAHRNAVETVRALLGDAAAISLRPTTTASPALLENWCDAIDNSLRGRDWHAVNVGLSRFSPVLAEAITAERQLLAAAAASCAEVDDLQGRFQALKAKERALRARASLPERCAALRARLDAALAQRPLVLPELRSALSSYQALLAAGGRPSSPRS